MTEYTTLGRSFQIFGVLYAKHRPKCLVDLYTDEAKCETSSSGLCNTFWCTYVWYTCPSSTLSCMSAMALTWRGEWGKAPCIIGIPKKVSTAFSTAITSKSQWYAVPFFNLVENVIIKSEHIKKMRQCPMGLYHVLKLCENLSINIEHIIQLHQMPMVMHLIFH